MATEVNYFLLLELPFDPPETNSKIINNAITKKQAQWSRDMINPMKKAEASQYMAQIDKIRNVMLNAELRQEEAENAKKIKCDHKKELDSKLTLYRAKGDILADKDLKQLVRIFGRFGFTETEIRQAFEKKSFQKPVLETEVLDKSQAKNVKNFMRQLNLEDKTLYDFLNLMPTASCGQLCDVAESIKKEILSKGNPTGIDNARQSLCGLCAVIFKNTENKKRYDNYVNLTRYGKVNDAIDEMALGNQKRIEPKMKEGLIDFAVSQYQLTVSDASIYINNYCEYMRYVLPENRIICGICNTENPAGTTNCVKCGKALIIQCPSCGTENNNSAKSCAKCGFDFTQMERAIELLRQAKKKCSIKEWDEAEGLLREAKILWPNHVDVALLEKSIVEAKKINFETVSDIKKDIEEKRMYSARAKIEQASAKGIKVDESLSDKVSNAIKNVESRLSQLDTTSDDVAFHTLISLIGIVSDSKEVSQGLKKFPPNSCKELQGQINGNSLILKWAPSSSEGNIIYKLIRKENNYSNALDDGILIYEGKRLEYVDNNIQKNTVFCYSLFVERLGVSSLPTKLITPIAIVDAVENMKSVGGDEMVTLSWKKASTVKEIKLWKYCGIERPDDERQYEIIPCTRLDGLTIHDLKNGQQYWFAVSAGHILNGRSYFSEKVYSSAVPQKPIDPLQGFTVQYSNDLFQATWQKTQWEVILFYSKTEPKYTIGIVYDIEELLEKYQKIELSLKSKTNADFKINFIGECYIIPGVISATNVILNKPSYISAVPCVKNVSFDLNSSSTEMYVNFTWPPKVERSMIVYRMDDYPTGTDDPLATKIECNKRQYEANEGIVISNPAEGTFYASLYTYFEIEGRRIYSEEVRALLSNEPQKEIYYCIKYKKAGFFRKKYTLTINIEVRGKCVFPPFVIVGKFKSTPLKRGDGEIVCSIDTNSEIENEYTFSFDISPLRPETRLKMFFTNDKYYKSFKLACKSGNIV